MTGADGWHLHEHEWQEARVWFTKRMVVVAMVLLGGVALVVSITLRHPPERSVIPVSPQSVITQTLVRQPSAPVAIGYGYLYPRNEWQGIAEVSGMVTYLNPQLEKGQWLTKGTELLRIDATSIALTLRQAEAQLASAKSALVKLTKQQAYFKQILAIEHARLKLAQRELERRVNLRKKGLTSQADVDQQQLQCLTQQKLVEDIQTQQAVLPQDIDAVHAQIQSEQARVNEASNQLAKTTIILPMDAYIDDVSVQLNQVVTLQQTMVAAHQPTIMNVDAQIPNDQFRLLVDSVNGASAVFDAQFRSLKCELEFKLGNQFVDYPARIIQVARGVDTQRGTIGIVLEVVVSSDPQRSPFLIKGTFVKAKIYGRSHAHWVVPEQALHSNRIYIKTPDNRLAIRPVSVLYRVDDQVTIDGHIRPHEQLILNDLLPAVAGMSVQSPSSLSEWPHD